MKEMKGQLEKRSELDKEAAVKKYQIAQAKVNTKIFNTIKGELPKQMRSVVQQLSL